MNGIFLFVITGGLLSSAGVEDGGSVPSSFSSGHDAADEYCVGCW